MSPYTSQIAVLKLLLDDYREMESRFRALDRASQRLSHRSEMRRRLRMLDRSLQQLHQRAILCLILFNLHT